MNWIKKYHYHDDYEYRGIKNIHNLLKLSIDKDHYKPLLVKSGYDNNYIRNNNYNNNYNTKVKEIKY